MARSPEEIKAAWPEDKRAAFERLEAAFWSRVDELARTETGANLELHVRISRGKYAEGRLDPDLEFS